MSIMDKVTTELLNRRGFTPRDVQITPISELKLTIPNAYLNMGMDEYYRIELKIGAQLTVRNSVELEHMKGRVIDAIKSEMYSDITNLLHHAMSSVMMDNREEAMKSISKILDIVS